MNLSARTWRLDRYANLVKEWRHSISTPTDPVTISILNDHKLLIAQGTTRILESLTLWESTTWIKGVRKGSAVLLVIKSPLNDSSRKIRFQFLADAGMTAEEQAVECVTCLSVYFNFERDYTKDAFSQFKQEPQGGQRLLLSDMSKLMLGGDVSAVLGDLYSKTVFPKEQMRYMLTLCLSDPNFPGFVAEVEQSLKQMNTTTKQSSQYTNAVQAQSMKVINSQNLQNSQAGKNTQKQSSSQSSKGMSQSSQFQGRENQNSLF